MRQIAALVGDLRLMVVTNEQPNELSIQATASGLPNLNAIVQAALAAHPPGRSGPVRIQTREPRRIEERRALPPPAAEKSAPPQQR